MLPYETKILHGLTSKSFSNIETNRLPVALPKIVQLAEATGGKFTDDALCFSIMAGNATLVEDIVSKRTDRKMTGMNPIHLSVSYLFGSTACCSILQTLLRKCLGTVVDMYALDYSPLERLMVSIIRSHTSTPPQLVDVCFGRFPGDEVDICGRWSVEHSAIRDVLSDESGIASEWKHKFCNTSLQIVCHSLLQLLRIDILTSKQPLRGLFAKKCPFCNLQLEPFPLHTLVLTGWYLANNGTKNEDLFGIITLLLGMLKCGANLRLKAPISISALTPQVRGPNISTSKCDHQHLSANELTALLPQYPAPTKGSQGSLDWSGKTWSQSVMTGWLLLVPILKCSVIEVQTHLKPTPLGHAHHKSKPCFVTQTIGFHHIHFGKSKLDI